MSLFRDGQQPDQKHEPPSLTAAANTNKNANHHRSPLELAA